MFPFVQPEERKERENLTRLSKATRGNKHIGEQTERKMSAVVQSSLQKLGHHHTVSFVKSYSAWGGGGGGVDFFFFRGVIWACEYIYSSPPSPQLFAMQVFKSTLLSYSRN